MPEIHFEWRITLEGVLQAVWMSAVVIVAMWRVWRKMDARLSIIMSWAKEFPPHRHVGKTMLFPKGMEPGEAVRPGITGRATS